MPFSSAEVIQDYLETVARLQPVVYRVPFWAYEYARRQLARQPGYQQKYRARMQAEAGERLERRRQQRREGMRRLRQRRKEECETNPTQL